MKHRCLTNREFEQFEAGELPAEETVRISQHLEWCDACGSSYGGLLSDDDLLAELRQAASAVGVDRPSSLPSYRPKPVPSPTIPKRIHGYEITREIQRGAQGIVFEAMQLATKRKVALKILLEERFGDPSGKRRRFEAEIELASQLRHPNIVSIFDSGLYEGQFFFAMEFVDGPRLDEYVVSAKLSVKQTIALFGKVCAAVRHAHEHGVIHRDLKPSNIRIDAKGEPHLLDFGLARRIESFDDARITASHRFMGTLAYAAPEQTTGSGTADTRSDVYALGIVLYELLTGGFPYSIEGPLVEVARRIQSDLPERPVSKRPEVDADVEAIIFKALEKVPQQRYASAGDLEADVQRYLHGEPLAARRANKVYVARKLLSRHRGKALVAVAGVALFVVVLSWSVWSIASARQGQMAAYQAAGQINVFMQDMLNSLERESLADRDIAVLHAIIDDVAGRIDRDYADQPDVAASLKTSIGNTYRALGLFDKAEAQLKDSLQLRTDLYGRDHVDVADSMGHLALLLRDQQQFEQAEQMQREASAIIVQEVGKAHHLYADAQHHLATILYAAGRLDESRELYEQALQLLEDAYGEDHEELAHINNNYAELLRQLGDYALAEQHVRDAIEQTSERRENDPLLTTALNNLGLIQKSAGQFAEAEQSFTLALQKAQARYGDRHHVVAQIQDNLGTLLKEVGRTEEANDYYRIALAVRKGIWGPDHHEVATSLNNLGMLLRQEGDLQEAEALLSRALQINTDALGADHINTIAVSNNLASLLFARKDFDTLIPLLKGLLETRTTVLGANHKLTADSMNNLASAYRLTGELQHAKELYSEAIHIYRDVLSESHPAVANGLNNLALTEKKLGNTDKAQDLYGQAVTIYRAAYGNTHLLTANALHNLGRLMASQQQCADARPLFEEALQTRSQILGPEHATTNKTRTALVNCLINMQAFLDAEVLLDDSYKAAVETFGQDDKRTSAIVEQFIQLYDAWNKPDQASQWRQK